MRKRIEENLKIHEVVGNFLVKHPEMRYIQALWALGIVSREDRFYEEPDETYELIPIEYKKENLAEDEK